MKKTASMKQYEKNHPLSIFDASWEFITMDFLVNLPSSALGDQKYNSLYVVIDTFTKMCHLILIMIMMKAEDVAKLYFEYIYHVHDFSKGITSDRDIKFIGTFGACYRKWLK